eukprot:TRINITY_DN28278_c0_g1_i1.p1 TRINITY_DN28278_c0_g1~~TRINITY_DN28278_c0_g1_i1.p1  ORF type:complete len:157 (-),score=12.68 TRINITY_DN28278_c0_g1_i1:15-422(-)
MEAAKMIDRLDTRWLDCMMMECCELDGVLGSDGKGLELYEWYNSLRLHIIGSKMAEQDFWRIHRSVMAKSYFDFVEGAKAGTQSIGTLSSYERRMGWMWDGFSRFGILRRLLERNIGTKQRERYANIQMEALGLL